MDVPDDLELFAQMCFLRHFEERTDALYRQGLIHGPVHLGLGQEAIAVGAASVLCPGDYSLGTYRGHAHALARGAPPDAVLAELLGKTGGICGGKGGSMHITSVEHGYLFGRQCADLQAGGEGGRAKPGRTGRSCCSMYWRRTKVGAPPIDPEPDHRRRAYQ
jgi:TPP-dependent pyruvate/acetoin dehydrogenase alpha subunit